MLYFTRTVTNALGEQLIEFAISENTERLEQLTVQGFEQCSLATFREAWRRRDAEAFARLRTALTARRVAAKLGKRTPTTAIKARPV